ncbi:hypothetical protein C3L33_06280, partial [Rhododendron williamsianum]
MKSIMVCHCIGICFSCSSNIETSQEKRPLKRDWYIHKIVENVQAVLCFLSGFYGHFRNWGSSLEQRGSCYGMPNRTGDCHDPHGLKDMCVAGAIQNFTTQLSHYREGTSDRRHNMTEALLFVSHFMGDIHQVWDREIILTAAKDYYGKDMDLLRQDIEANFTDGLWREDVTSWTDCSDMFTCVNKWAVESINIACHWGYKDVESGETLNDDYFNSRLPIVMKRIAQGGVRLAMILNRVFGDSEEDVEAAST